MNSVKLLMKYYNYEHYSRFRNYLYTHKMARIQSSPAAVGCLFPDEL